MRKVQPCNPLRRTSLGCSRATSFSESKDDEGKSTSPSLVVSLTDSTLKAGAAAAPPRLARKERPIQTLLVYHRLHSSIALSDYSSRRPPYKIPARSNFKSACTAIHRTDHAFQLATRSSRFCPAPLPNPPAILQFLDFKVLF